MNQAQFGWMISFFIWLLSMFIAGYVGDDTGFIVSWVMVLFSSFAIAIFSD